MRNLQRVDALREPGDQLVGLGPQRAPPARDAEGACVERRLQPQCHIEPQTARCAALLESLGGEPTGLAQDPLRERAIDRTPRVALADRHSEAYGRR